MRLAVFVLGLVLMSGCASGSATSGSWKRYTVTLSGKSLSFSSPPGDFPVKYTPFVNLATNQRDNIMLFHASWVFSGFLADAGGLSFHLRLGRAPVGEGDDALIQGVEAHISDMDQKRVTLSNVRKQSIGGRQWLCFPRPKQSDSCVLKIDSQHYLKFGIYVIDNSKTKLSIKARDDLSQKILDSIQVEF